MLKEMKWLGNTEQAACGALDKSSPSRKDHQYPAARYPVLVGWAATSTALGQAAIHGPF